MVELQEMMKYYELNQMQSVPDHTLQALNEYLSEKHPPGDFLHAVLCNNLARAFMKADDKNIANMYAIVKHIYNNFPANAWGSADNVQAWVDSREQD